MFIAHASMVFSKHSSGPCCTPEKKKKTDYPDDDQYKGCMYILYIRKEANLTDNGAIGFEESISPWNQPEIDNGDEAVLEHFDQMIHYKISTIRTQSFVVKRDRYLLTRRCKYEQQPYTCEKQTSPTVHFLF